MSLDGVNVDRLRKMVALLSSNQDGEVVAAVRAIGRTLESAKRNWNDLAESIGGGAFKSFGAGDARLYAELAQVRNQLAVERRNAEDHRKTAERNRKLAMDAQNEVKRLKVMLEQAYRSGGERPQEEQPKQERPKRERYRPETDRQDDPDSWTPAFMSDLLDFLLRHVDDLSDWEVNFTESIATQSERFGFNELSFKQRSKLMEVARRHGWRP